MSARPPTVAKANAVPRFLKQADRSGWPRGAQPPSARKKETILLRRMARNAEYALPSTPLGRSHPFYMRKEASYKAAPAKPSLNTRDCAEAYKLPGEMKAAARLAADELEEANAAYHAALLAADT